MPAIAPADITGRIAWLGTVPDRGAALASHPAATLDLTLDGPAGEDHGGAARPSCSRVMNLYPRGTEIRNVRQLSILSVEEMAAIADEMGLDRLKPEWLGATMVLEGIPDLSFLPPSSRLQANGHDGATLTVDMNNRPCTLPAKVIADHVGAAGKGFKSAAEGRRGVTAWVERAGAVAVGDPVALFVPDQRPWRGAA